MPRSCRRDTPAPQLPRLDICLRRRTQAVVAAFDSEAEFLGLPTRGSAILRSPLLPLQRLLLELDDHARLLGAEERLELLERVVQSCEGVAAGSALHVVMAARLAARSRGMHERGAAEAREAELRCAQAHVARYGADLDGALLAALIKHHESLATGAALAAQISALAWDAAIGL